MKKRILAVALAMLVSFMLVSFAGCHEHDLVPVKATEPTCVRKGNVEYFKCSVCGDIFLDAEGRDKASESDVSLDTIPHDFVYVSNTETDHIYECKNCGEEKTEPHQMSEVSGRNVGHLYKTACECGYAATYESIPTVSIKTDNGQEIQGNRTSAEYYACKVSVSDCDEEYAMTDVTARVKVRGTYSADYSKKPYKIKFDSKQVMLGVNEDLKAKEWVLLADYKDRSLLRNPTVHKTVITVRIPDSSK